MKCRVCPAVLGARREGRAYGLCRNCWVRWQSAGFPEDGPQPPERPWGRVVAARLEDYADLRSWGVSVADAAGRSGVSLRTAQRYELRRRGVAPRRYVRKAGNVAA